MKTQGIPLRKITEGSFVRELYPIRCVRGIFKLECGHMYQYTRPLDNKPNPTAFPCSACAVEVQTEEAKP